jgi:photosystem II stability/assembly factor-like uncharacterized protein
LKTKPNTFRLLLFLGVWLCSLLARGGQIWTQSDAPELSWRTITASADGRKMAAAANAGAIYTSTNSGANWLPTASPTSGWRSIAGSADGTVLIAGTQAGLD